jgi:hypothetical protein
MTEIDWPSCTDPARMLEFLKGKASDRKLRLFAVACCERVNQLFIPETRQALAVAEQFAEGKATSQQRKQARAVALRAGWIEPPALPLELIRHARGPAKSAVCDVLARKAIDAATGASRSACHAATAFSVNSQKIEHPHAGVDWMVAHEAASKNEQKTQCEILRCCIGNPFRAVVLEAAWQVPELVRLAQVVYDDTDFSLMAGLAKRLTELGCTNADVLSHCYITSQHVRGCWVVDLILGK